MSPVLKAIIGLLLTLAAGWIWHSPLGNGERLIGRLEAEARSEVAKSELPGIELHLSRAPLARTATLRGPADEIQREGLGSQKGVSDYARGVEGLSEVRWADESDAGRRVIPLVLETLGLAALAYLIGLGLGWLVWRRRSEDFD
jgi:hypothetical protein